MVGGCWGACVCSREDSPRLTSRPKVGFPEDWRLVNPSGVGCWWLVFLSCPLCLPYPPDRITSSLKLETSDLELETSSLELETSSLELETSNLELETSSLELETSNLEPETSCLEPEISFSELASVQFTKKSSHSS
ncbi:MAG: hypothetical protein ACHBN1_03415 [Heteroscytonema crispum UTEX LB 1556]